MHVVDLIIGMNLSLSQTKRVQSWGLGHSGRIWKNTYVVSRPPFSGY
jgi:hypothetical protein